MTWGELKAALEAAGVPDDAEMRYQANAWCAPPITSWALGYCVEDEVAEVVLS